MVSSTHEQNSICSEKKLNAIAHEHTIVCKQLFAGHVVGSRPMKGKKHLHRMIMCNMETVRINNELNRIEFLLWRKNISSSIMQSNGFDAGKGRRGYFGESQMAAE